MKFALKCLIIIHGICLRIHRADLGKNHLKPFHGLRPNALFWEQPNLAVHQSGFHREVMKLTVKLTSSGTYPRNEQVISNSLLHGAHT